MAQYFLSINLAPWPRIIKAAGKPSETQEELEFVSVIFERVGVYEILIKKRNNERNSIHHKKNAEVS